MNLTKNNDKRVKLLAKLNSVATDLELAARRVEHAGAALCDATKTVDDREIELRAEMENELQRTLSIIRERVLKAKSEAGTARSEREKLEQTYRLTRLQLMKCLPSLDDEAQKTNRAASLLFREDSPQ